MCPHQRANAGGIHVGHIGKIDNKQAGAVGPDDSLKLKDVGEGERTFEAQDSVAIDDGFLDVEWAGLHGDGHRSSGGVARASRDWTASRPRIRTGSSRMPHHFQYALLCDWTRPPTVHCASNCSAIAGDL